MKYLIILLCLCFVGCESSEHDRRSKKLDALEQAAILRVLSARDDIRMVISHTPANEQELNGPARQDPNALIFNVQDFTSRLQRISLNDCPEDFRVAFVNYAEAWNDRAAANPRQEIILKGGRVPAPEEVPAEAQATEAAWRALLQVSARYLTPVSTGD